MLLTPKPTTTTTTTTKPPAVGPGATVPNVHGGPPTWVDRLLALTGIDADRCARCGAGRLVRQPLDGRPTPSPWDTS